MTSLRRETGHTLPELLTGLAMASIIMLATFALLEHVMKRTGETQARVEATQRGRQAMDTMTRALRSQVCLGATTPAIAAGANSTVTYYTDLGNGSKPPEKHVLTYDPATRKITQAIHPGTGMPPATTFDPTPVQTKLLAESVHPAGSAPIFSYYAYDDLTPPKAELALPGPVAAADLGRIARISIAYITKAGAAAAIEPASVTFGNDVYIRAADPNDPAPYPTCA